MQHRRKEIIDKNWLRKKKEKSTLNSGTLKRAILTDTRTCTILLSQSKIFSGWGNEGRGSKAGERRGNMRKKG